MKKTTFVLLVFIMYCFNSICQNIYISDSYIHFKTDNFDLYIPQINNADSLGKRIISHLEYLYKPLSKTMEGKPNRFPIIIQPYTEQSNGYVNFVYRRSEFFLRPTQNYNLAGNTNWLDLLCIHEFRHVVQYYHSSRGLNRISYYLFGSIGQAGMMALKMRPWFFEGDAVYTETKHTHGGRGENNYFISQYLALLNQNEKPLTYNLSVLRSYNLNIPNHYVFGYLMVNHINNKYGEQTWNKIIDKTSKTWWIPGAMTRITKKHTGKHISEHFFDMNDSLRSTMNIKKMKSHKYKKVLKTRNYQSYNYPMPIPEGVIYVKNDFNDNSRFVLVDNNKVEQSLDRVINLTDASILTADKMGNIYYLELYPSPRRQSEISYSRVVVYNVHSRKRHYLLNKTRIVSLAISPSGNQLLILERTIDTKYELKVYDKKEFSNWGKNGITRGHVIKTFTHGEQLFTPRWSDDEQTIIGVYNSVKGNEIISINKNDGRTKILVEPTGGWYGKPYLSSKYLLFESNILGYTQVFRKNISNNQIYEITKEKPIANTTPIFDTYRDKLILITTTWDGNKHIDVSIKEEGKQISFNSKIIANVLHDKGEILTYDKIPKQYLSQLKYTMKKQKWNIVGFRPYRWGITGNSTNFSSNNNLYGAGIGFSDKLNYLNIQLGYYRSQSYNISQYELKTTFEGFKLGTVDINFKKSNYVVSYLATGVNGTIRLLDDETKTNTIYDLGINIPIWLRKSHFEGKFDIRPHVEILAVNGGSLVGNLYRPNYSRFSVGNEISFDLVRPKHYRSLTSRLGIKFILSTRSSYFNFDDIKHESIGVIKSWVSNDFFTYAITGRLYLPGVFKNDSIVITERYNKTNSNNLTSQFGSIFYDIRNTGILIMTYNLPFLYPDIGIYSLFNIKRASWLFNANIYQDYNIENLKLKRQYRVSLQLDVNILRLPQDMQLTISYVKDEDTSNILVGFNILSFINTN